MARGGEFDVGFGKGRRHGTRNPKRLTAEAFIALLDAYRVERPRVKEHDDLVDVGFTFRGDESLQVQLRVEGKPVEVFGKPVRLIYRYDGSFARDAIYEELKEEARQMLSYNFHNPYDLSRARRAYRDRVRYWCYEQQFPIWAEVERPDRKGRQFGRVVAWWAPEALPE